MNLYFSLMLNIPFLKVLYLFSTSDLSQVRFAYFWIPYEWHLWFASIVSCVYSSLCSFMLVFMRGKKIVGWKDGDRERQTEFKIKGFYLACSQSLVPYGPTSTSENWARSAPPKYYSTWAKSNTKIFFVWTVCHFHASTTAKVLRTLTLCP